MQGNPEFMKMAISLATQNVLSGKGGPFGAVVVRGDEILATGVNLVTATNDPTAHAEITAIRAACQSLGAFQLSGCDVYTSCEPCPMCLAAIYWARCDRIFYGNTAADAAEAGFDDSFLYAEIAQPHTARTLPIARLLGDDAIVSFEAWKQQSSRIEY